MTKSESDYLYEVWRHGGNPDRVVLDDIPIDFDWAYCTENPFTPRPGGPYRGKTAKEAT